MMISIVEAGLGNALVALVLAGLALGVGLVCRRPAVAHALWLLVLIKLVTPPLISVPFPARVEEESPSAPREFSYSDFALLEVADRLPLELSPNPEVAKDEEGAAVFEAAEPIEPFTSPRSPSSRVALQTIIGLVWLAGSLVWFGVAMRRLWRFGRLLRHARTAPEEFILRVVEISRRLGLAKAPRIWLVPGRVSPMVWSVGRVTLLVPEGLIEKLSGPALDTLVAHELAHVRRRDPWVRWLELIALGLYWWNPVAWLARRELGQAEELCCDAWVVRCLPDARRVYATALVDALDFLSQPAEPVPTLGCGLGQVDDLKRRLTMILRGSTPPRMGWTTILCTLGLAGLLLPLAPGLGWAEDRPSETKPAYRIRLVAKTLVADLPDLKKLDPKLQAEIHDLIKKRQTEQQQREDAIRNLQRARGMFLIERAVQASQQQGSPDLATLEKELQKRQAEIEAIKAQILSVRTKGTTPERPRDNEGATVHLALVGFTGSREELGMLTRNLEKALASRVKEVKIVAVHVSPLAKAPPRENMHPRFELQFHGPIRFTTPENAPHRPQPGTTPTPEIRREGGNPAERRIEALEKKLDAVLRELEKVRQGMKPVPPAATPPPATPAGGNFTPVPAPGAKP